MDILKFKFYDFTKPRDITLRPDSELLIRSSLVPKSTAAKYRKYGSNTLPPHGPVNAPDMTSSLMGTDGYGELDYSEFPYGESVESTKIPINFSCHIPHKQQDICNVSGYNITEKVANISSHISTKRKIKSSNISKSYVPYSAYINKWEYT